jgi:glycosyltransferase involved in cell wall biosynthesis
MQAKKIKVLHIITRLILGGAQENTLLTAAAQHRSGAYDVVLLSGIDEGPEGTLHEEARSQGVTLVLMPGLVRPIRPVKDFMTLIALYRFIKHGKFDIVHTHSSKAGILGRMAARMAGVPVVVHTLHSLVFHEFQSRVKNRFYILLKRLCAPLTDLYISVCDAVTRGALSERIGSPARYVTVYSGIDLTPFSEAKRLSTEEAKTRIGLDPACLVVGKVARLFHQKGHELFLTAAPRIAAEIPSEMFLLVGDGVLRQHLMRLAEDLGISRRVIFSGRVSPTDIPIYLRAMDVVVHTSVREGIARVIPQAYAAGRPVVALNLDGAPEVIEHGRTGFLVEPGSVGDLCSAVTQLLGSSQLRNMMADAGRDIVFRKFPIELMIKRIDEIYAELLSSKGLQQAATDSSSQAKATACTI